jgi:ribonuclease HIII
VIENLAKIRTDCPRALSDQFANPAVLERELKKKGLAIQLDQQTKAESDVAVAAASILARERFIDWMRAKGRELQVEMPRGASALVKQVARDLMAKHGQEILRSIAKTHFKTASELAPELFPPPPPGEEKPPFRRKFKS